MYYRLFSIPFSYTPSINTGLTGSNQFIQPIFPIPVIGYKQDSSSNEPNVPQSVAHLICVPQVPQMWHKMWHNSIYILSTNQYMSMKICVRGRRRLNHNFCSKKLPRFLQGKLISLPFDCLERHKSVALLCQCHKCHKCGTSVAPKRGLTRFLDDLGIMHVKANTLASEASKLFAVQCLLLCPLVT